MRWIAAALVLMLVQHAAGLGRPALPREPSHVASLLAGGTRSKDAVELEGRVADAAPTWGAGVRLTVAAERADGAPTEGLVSVSLRETKRRWRTGDRLAVTSRLRRITGFGNFGELDWSAYNARRGVFVSAYAWEDDDVRRLEPADGLVDRARRRFAEACERAGGQGAEILEALTIGDRTGIDRATSDAVRDAGLAHFLAISGSHMALLVALVVGMVRAATRLTPALLERYDVLRAAAVLAAVAVVAYGAVSGGGVSVSRSVLMALAAMAALWRGRPGDDLRALGGSAIVLALAMPGVAGEAGFQLSYLAVSALVLDARRRREARRQAPEPERPAAARRVLHVLYEAARLSLVCWLVTTPIVAHHFQRVSFVAPLANLLAAPLVSAIVVSGIGGLVVLPVSPGAGDLAAQLGAGLSELVLALSRWCASLPMAAATTAAPGPWLTWSLTAAALATLAPPSRHRRAAVVAAAAVAVIAGAGSAHDRWRTDRLDVWFASVGQGDGAIVRMPGGRVWVIDQGSPGRGRMVMAPLLRRAWIGRIDVLVASHVQSDHSGALVELLEEFEVGEVWLPAGPCDNDAARAIVETARVRGVPVRAIAAGVVHDGVEVLSPPGANAACNHNDQSLVVRLDYAGRRVLFTGDIEAAAESRLANGDARADVLKVPHHGSRTSSSAAFLDAVRPAIAVASLGLDNQFRFPAPEVVRRYEERGVKLLRTDRDGAVHLTIDEKGKMELETFRAEE